MLPGADTNVGKTESNGKKKSTDKKQLYHQSNSFSYSSPSYSNPEEWEENVKK